MPVWRALYICLLKEGGFEREELEELSDVIYFSEKVGSMSNDFQKLHKRLIKYLVLYVDTIGDFGYSAMTFNFQDRE